MKTTDKRAASEWYLLVTEEAANKDIFDSELQKEFKQWLDESVENRHEYEKYSLTMDLLESVEDDKFMLAYIEEAKSAVEKTRKEGDNENIITNFFSTFVRPLSICLDVSTRTFATLSLCFLMLGMFGSHYLYKQSLKPSALNSGIVSTSIGEKNTLALEDGSEVVLNTSSELNIQYSKKYRQLKLNQGEAIFTVEHDASRPFDVHVGNGIVRAIGTRFAIHVDGNEVVVSVLEGKITILKKKKIDGSLAILTQGYTARFSVDEWLDVAIDDIEHKRVEAWLEGKLVFANMRLADALAEHNRYAKKHIFVTDEVVAEKELSGIFKVGDTQAFIEALELILALEVTEQKGHYLVH